MFDYYKELKTINKEKSQKTMSDNINKYQDVIKMASSTTDTGYEEIGYSTTTSNGNNVTVSVLVDTHYEYKKKISIKVEDGYHINGGFKNYNEYHMNYNDVYQAFKNNAVKLSKDDPIYKACISDNSTNHNDYMISNDELMKYIAKCLNVNEKLTFNIIRNFPGTSTDMKIRAFSTMIQFVEKNQEVMTKDNILQGSINAMNDYIENLE